jgi:hypothetical protein
MIVDIEESPLKNKRFRVFMDNNRHFDFGLKNGNTYIDHNNLMIRNAYLSRHYAISTEKYFIDNLIPSPALFSWYLTWGKYKTLEENINFLNNLWKLKNKNKLNYK